jgi:hypothetical protein
VQEEDE